jgi:hypothetical protein
MRRAIVGAFAAVAVLAFVSPAFGAVAVEHLHFHAGPYRIAPGANLILLQTNQVPKPSQDGFMVRMAPNLRYTLPNGKCCGKVPLTNVIHLHHGVWLSDGPVGQGEGSGLGGFYPFMASGEEKTVYEFPAGYGYPISATDHWILNYMIHDLTNKGARVYITYDIDFIPLSSPLAESITPLHPIWMDVEDRNIYPVFDVLKGSGHNGKFTFPDMAKNPYHGGPPLNEFTVDHAGALIGTAGHLHPGGLYDDLDLIRAGATPKGGAIPGSVPDSVRLFRSYAQYFGHRAPISWDMAMTATAADWRPEIQPGDVLKISATYDTRHGSWYESMGIMVAWEAWNDQTGVNPFTHALDQRGHVTHGHLSENSLYGGTMPLGVNLKKFKTCMTNKVIIGGFHFTPGDFTSTGPDRCIPTVRKGHSITFVNDDAYSQATLNLFNPDAAYLNSVFHSVTACKFPCNQNTGISYPLANGAGGFDSGQLGAATPAIGRLSWSTPQNLPPGTYTFFCRIHPYMRGVFRIIG